LKDWRYSTDQESIAWAVFDREGERVNTLSRRAIEELGAIIIDAESKAAAGAIKGLVFTSGKEGGYIYGADIREFDNFRSEDEVRASVSQVTEMLDRLDAFSIPTVAAINGLCLGGGLELALACHWRIATRAESTRVGFPEIKLGIFPGFNGTVRSIRQAGPTNAMTAMFAVAYEPVPSVATLQTELPDDMGRLIDSLLAKDPDERPASAKVALALIEEVERQLNTTPEFVIPVPRRSGSDSGEPPAEEDPESLVEAVEINEVGPDDPTPPSPIELRPLSDQWNNSLPAGLVSWDDSPAQGVQEDDKPDQASWSDSPEQSIQADENADQSVVEPSPLRAASRQPSGWLVVGAVCLTVLVMPAVLLFLFALLTGGYDGKPTSE